MSTSVLTKKCFGCGTPHKPGFLLCRVCWRLVPIGLRFQFNGAPDIGARRGLAKQILKTVPSTRSGPAATAIAS